MKTGVISNALQTPATKKGLEDNMAEIEKLVDEYTTARNISVSERIRLISDIRGLAPSITQHRLSSLSTRREVATGQLTLISMTKIKSAPQTRTPISSHSQSTPGASNALEQSISPIMQHSESSSYFPGSSRLTYPIPGLLLRPLNLLRQNMPEEKDLRSLNYIPKTA